MKILILAGGSGKRLWPVSRKNKPKQFRPLVGNQTLLKATYDRVRKGFGQADIYLSENVFQVKAVKKELGLKSVRNFIAEPIKKGTAGAISLACIRFKPSDIIATVNADHYIKDQSEFNRILKVAGEAVKKYPDHLVLVGINPTYPETGYGYIKLSGQAGKIGKDKIFRVESFKEKPDFKTAQKYLKSWAYLWNPAYFVFKAGMMLELFKKHLPAHYRILMRIKNKPSLLKSEFKKLKKESIDYGIMEKAGKMLCLPAEFDWQDVGHWRTVHEILSGNTAKNVVQGKYVHLDGSGNLIYAPFGKLVATVGVKDAIIIDTADALLVCPKSRAQDVKKIVEELERKGMKRYL